MFRITDVLQPKSGERVLAVVRRHAITLWPKLFLAGLLIVVPFFFLFVLTKWGTPGLVAFIVLVASGLLLALHTFLLWDADVLVITTQRLVDVDQQGLWTRTVSETSLAAIQEIRCERKGIGETLCRMGTLRIRTYGSNPEIAATRIPRPERYQRMISALLEPHQTTEPADEKVESIRHMLAQADPNVLSAVESILKEEREREE